MFLFHSDVAVFVTAHGSSLCDPSMCSVAQVRRAGLLRSSLDSEELRAQLPLRTARVVVCVTAAAAAGDVAAGASLSDNL